MSSHPRAEISVTEPSKFLKPAPMEGKGAYNRSSSVQAAGSLPAVALLERTAHAVALPPSPEGVIIADYGSSEGRNSLVPMTAAIGVLRKRVGNERAIFVFHADLPGNDFTALFETLANDPDSYLRKDAAVFSAAIGRSYFEQILPASSVTLGWSAWAVQWLSRVPCAIPDQVQVAYSHDATARSAFAQQAAEDWRTFLSMRSRELRPGAGMVVLTMAIDDDGDFGYRQVVDALYGALVDMADRGLIRKEEFRRMAIPAFGRTRAQFTEPFAKPGVLQISLSRISNCSTAKMVSGLSLKQTATLLHLGRNGLLSVALRYFQRSLSVLMAYLATRVRPSSSTSWKPVLLYDSRQRRSE